MAMGQNRRVKPQSDIPKRIAGSDLGERILLFSREHRDALSGRLASMGWPVIGVRHANALLARLMATGAMVAVLDLRELDTDSIAEIRTLGAYADANGLAVLALIGSGTESRLTDIMPQGLTHFLALPASDAAMGLAVDLAMRSARHTIGQVGALLYDRQRDWQRDYSWQLTGTAPCEFGRAIKDWLGEELLARYPRTALYRRLSVSDRQAARSAMLRITQGQSHAAFRHDLSGRNVLHHLHLESGALWGHVEDEWLQSWSERDAVTGLANTAATRQWLAEAEGRDSPVAIALVGLQHLEMVNTSYGRATGDNLLGRVGRRLKRLAEEQPMDDVLVARISGREFCIAFAAPLTVQRLNLIGQELLDCLERPFPEHGRDIVVSARVGLALRHPGEQGSQLMRRASLALGEALASDSLLVCISGEEDRNAVHLDEMIDRDLRSALDGGQIEVLFQPQFDVAGGRITGCEALARWQHDRLGLLGAETLFKVAERSGFMLPLSAHIQRLALEYAAQWPAHLSHLRLSINVTPQDLSTHNFIHRLFRMIDDSGFAPDRLTLEITEGALMGNVRHVARRLERVRERGIAVAIDDFGTGYSSLAYLKKLPIDYLKMDKGLTQDIAGEERDRIVVLAVLSLAQSLGLKTVAEGVEDSHQLELLAREGCDYFQGFLRSPALSPPDFEKFAQRAC